MPENELVAMCAAHHRAEVARRNASGTADFFIPPTFDEFFKHRFLVIDKPEAVEASLLETDEENGGAFLAVFFGRTPEYAAETPGEPDYLVQRFPSKDLGAHLKNFTESIGWFYDSYVGDGTIYSDLLSHNMSHTSLL